jgi:PST family polysaccharide transporter
MLKKLNQPDVTKALGNLFWLGLERLVQIAVAIAIGGLLARYFGPELFGKWQYANTLLLVLAPLTWVCGAEILVPTIIQTRHLPESARPNIDTLGAILGSAFALRLGVSCLALLACWCALAAGWLDPTVGAMLGGLAVTLLFREPFGVISAWLQSRTYSKPALLISLSTALLKGMLVYVMVRRLVAPARFGWLWAAEAALIGAALLAYFVWTQGGRLGWRVTPALFKRFVSAGTVFWLGLICMYLFLKVDRLMLEHYVSYAELGRYSAAQQINENWITLALMLAQTLAPAFVYRIDNRLKLRRNVARLMYLAAALMALGALVLDLAAGLIIRQVFGPAFETAIPVLRCAVWLAVPAAVEAMGNLVVLKFQARYVLLLKWLLALLVALAVNALLIPRWGGYGALLGLACGYLSAVAVNFYYFRIRLHT